jgi:cysteine-rich repeat protein
MKSASFLVSSVSALVLFLACGSDDPAGPDSQAGAAGQGAEAGHGGSPTGDGGSTVARAGEGGTASGGESPAGEGGASGGAPDPSAGQAGAGGSVEDPHSTCGNGVLEATESCDDANTSSDDGCSDECRVEYLLDQGHLDLFELTYDEASQGLRLRVKDDTGLYQLDRHFREPEAVVVDVDAELAAFTVPEELGPDWAFLGSGGDTIYLLDQVQQDGLPWPGWNTERLLTSLPPSVELPQGDRPVQLVVDVMGPGEVFTFMSDGGGSPIHRYVSTDDDEPDVILAAPSSHEHTAWAFTAVGDYYLTVTPTLATSNSGTLTGPPSTYRFHIGSRLAPIEAAPELTISGGGAAEYDVHDTIRLSVSQSPSSTLQRYDWYRFVDGYVAIEGEHADTLSAHAAVAGDFLYTAALIGRSGRVAALGVTSVLVKD